MPLSTRFISEIQHDIRKIDHEINIIHKILNYQNDLTVQREKELEARYSFLFRERRRLNKLISFDEFLS